MPPRKKVKTADVAETEQEPLVIGVDGGTESIRAAVFRAQDGKMLCSHASPYATSFPKPGHAEQNPADWYRCLGEAVRQALAKAGAGAKTRVRAIAIDTTSCTVVALDKAGNALAPCLLWMDSRAAPFAKQIMDQAAGDPFLSRNCGGAGPLSAEWMLPKALAIKTLQPAVWAEAATVCEYQDYINLKLTGKLCCCNIQCAARWHWDADKALSQPYPAGRPLSLLHKVGLSDLLEKWPKEMVAAGQVVGGLTKQAAEDLGLPPELPVIQGGADAYVGMFGLNVLTQGQLALLTGSSHLQTLICTSLQTAKGIWGPYAAAPLPDVAFAEGGQSSTGALLRWAKEALFATQTSYQELDAQAARLPVGAEGLLALETFQGSRTPETDPFARGMLLGLSLAHTQAHMWRAFLEAICLGTARCIKALQQAGHSVTAITMAGGATRSSFWTQMHANATGLPVIITENGEAPMLGCAVLAAAAVGIHRDVRAATAAMVRVVRTVPPEPAAVEQYKQLLQVYEQCAPAVQPITHALHAYVERVSAASTSLAASDK